jgi:hypothetical protein
MAPCQSSRRSERHAVEGHNNIDGPPAIEAPEDTTPNGSKWLNVAAASAILFIGVGYTNTFGVFQDYYQTTLLPNESPLKIITIGSVASSLYLILGVFTGRFADLVGYRISLSIGVALMIGAMFAASVSHKYWQLFLSQGLMFGLGVAFAYLPAVPVTIQTLRAQILLRLAHSFLIRPSSQFGEEISRRPQRIKIAARATKSKSSQTPSVRCVYVLQAVGESEMS